MKTKSVKPENKTRKETKQSAVVVVNDIIKKVVDRHAKVDQKLADLSYSCLNGKCRTK